MRKELIDVLREESESEHVAFTEFALVYSRNKDGLYCFFEGDDDKKYYSFRISHIAEMEFRSFSCGGKRGVLKVFNLIKSKIEYKVANTLYFIDKDFDEQANEDDIYTTPCYSVENFYTSLDAVKRILINEFSLKEDSEDFNKAIGIYKNLQNSFHDEITILNAWLSCQQQLRKEKGISTHLRIDDVVGKYFKTVIDNNMQLIDRFAELNDVDFIENNLFNDAPKIEKKVLKRRISKFSKSNRQQLFRGKFEISFLISFLQKLQNDICKKKPILFTKKYKCNLRFETCTSLSILTQYADTPNCLMKYLRMMKNDEKHITSRCTGQLFRFAT